MDYETVIIGAGLIGLQKAIELDEDHQEKVLIIDYEEKKGGFLNYTGLRNTNHKEIIDERAAKLPYSFWGKTTATEIHVGSDETSHEIVIQTMNGPKTVQSNQIIIATGTIEKARGANRIPGTRPAGEMTPSLALSLLQRNYLPGLKPLIVMADKIAEAVAERMEVYPECDVITRNAEDVELLDIQGYPRVSSVTLRDRKNHTENNISCDSLIFSHGKIPNTAFLNNVHIDLNKGNYICTDQDGLTSIPGIYAFGDCAVQNK